MRTVRVIDGSPDQVELSPASSTQPSNQNHPRHQTHFEPQAARSRGPDCHRDFLLSVAVVPALARLRDDTPARAQLPANDRHPGRHANEVPGAKLHQYPAPPGRSPNSPDRLAAEQPARLMLLRVAWAPHSTWPRT